MNRAWKFKVKCDYSAISTEDYNQLLDEWAGLVYSQFCQQDSDKAKAPVTFYKDRCKNG